MSSDELTHAAKKDLGQHWLADEASLQAICNAAKLSADDIVLEIGPGLGTLTQLLVQVARQVIAVEFDLQLAAKLPKLVTADNLQVQAADILKFDLTHLPKGYKVVANIPYYLTSNLLRVLCESANPPQTMALLVQKEVAERVAAAPGAMSLLSVSVQYYCHASLDRVIPAVLFTPPPKVDSQILTLEYRQRPLFKDVNTKKYFQIVKAGFSQRRKKLRSSLSAGLHMGKSELEDLLQKASISPDKRPQDLSLEDWYAIYQQLK
jgi:16S rRNA (adenine1518-N6/adenine1519-N6)-dimethyltransferase